uniref:No apical meristem-associated C-terminal domain-containing protein n=1 Tax=Leersia perrieri TaxID=77586 RepID=A0A0D9X0J8_9ORYZ
MGDARCKMSRRSRREVAPLSPAAAAAAADVAGCFDGSIAASLQIDGVMDVPPEAQPAWRNGPMPQTNSGMDLRQFLNYFQIGQQPFIPPHPNVSFPPPWPPTAPMTNSGTSKSNSKAVINVDDGDDVRTAKRLPYETDEDERLQNSKGKFKDDDPSLQEDMKKYMDIQVAASKRHEEFIETQQRISDAKVEAARLRRESVLLESYQKLLTMDTSQMTDEMKAEHVIGLKILKDKLLGNTN